MTEENLTTTTLTVGKNLRKANEFLCFSYVFLVFAIRGWIFDVRTFRWEVTKCVVSCLLVLYIRRYYIFVRAFQNILFYLICEADPLIAKRTRVFNRKNESRHSVGG